jgi:hypothetical protein
LLLGALLGVAALLLVGALAAPKPWAWLFGLILSFPLAVLTYGALGVGIARAIGIGRFYSVPFGAEQVEDWHILASAAFWMCTWAALILWLLSRRR